MDRGRDRIVTTFYQAMTRRNAPLTTRSVRLDIQKMGEAMAPAPGRRLSDLGAGAAPVFLHRLVMGVAVVALACAGEHGARVTARDGGPSVLDAGAAPVAPVSDDRYWAAFLDDVVAGDAAAARAGYEATLTAADTAPVLAARAALRLADLEGAAGNRRRALELVARAAALAPGDDAIQDNAERVRARLIAAPPGAGDVRGPPVGTPLPGVPVPVVHAFATAEATLASVHRRRLKPVLEALSSSVRAKERATETAVRAYRVVAEAGGLARVAAQYRIGSLYHDLAIELVFDLPPELEPGVALQLRRTLRASAVGYVRKAAAAYRTCLAEPAPQADAAPWRAAAETDLRGAEELLGTR